MAVNLTAKSAEQLLSISGVQLFVAQAGIKKADKNDVTVMTLAEGTEVAGVFTQNRFCAAPVVVCKEHLAEQQPIRALVINTGNANAGTGLSGQENARIVCKSLADKLAIKQSEVLPFSTGVILEPLPVEKITNALDHLQQTDWSVAAEAIMTTDTVAKSASSEISLNGQMVKLTGIAKGSGMIQPNMATMLGFVATDAAISRNILNQLVKEVADASFNCISVDGDTSTNDSFIIMATGKSCAPVIESADSEHYQTLKAALSELALELAQAIVRDGEGATKFMTVEVNGANTREEARQVAYAIARSPLVKTAFFASDPNLGRLVCAIGYAGIEDLDINQIKMYLGDVLVVENGGRAASYTEEAGQNVMSYDEITVRVELNRGNVNATIYTCDFSYDYVRINADYRS